MTTSYDAPFDDNCVDANDGRTRLILNDEGLHLDVEGEFHSREITTPHTLLQLRNALSNWLYQWQCRETMGGACRCHGRAGHDGLHQSDYWSDDHMSNIHVEWSPSRVAWTKSEPTGD